VDDDEDVEDVEGDGVVVSCEAVDEAAFQLCHPAHRYDSLVCHQASVQGGNGTTNRGRVASVVHSRTSCPTWSCSIIPVVVAAAVVGLVDDV